MNQPSGNQLYDTNGVVVNTATNTVANGEKKRERGPVGGDPSRKPKKEDKLKVINKSATSKNETGKKGGENKGNEKNQLGIDADKATDFPKWYQQVVKQSELIEYYDISGCYILRPLAYSMWETIQVNDNIINHCPL